MDESSWTETERIPHEEKQNKTKQNIDVLVDFYYGVVHQLCGRIGEDSIQS